MILPFKNKYLPQVETLTKLATPLKKYVVLQAQFYGKENNTLQRFFGRKKEAG